MDWSHVDYCDVFINCLDSHSDGTHSLQSIHKWADDVMIHFSKSGHFSLSCKWQRSKKINYHFFIYIFMGFSCLSWDGKLLGGDRRGQDSNSGRCEHSCTLCQHTFIGADINNLILFYLFDNLSQKKLQLQLIIVYFYYFKIFVASWKKNNRTLNFLRKMFRKYYLF